MSPKNRREKPPKIRGLFLGRVEFSGIGGYPEKMLSELLSLGIKLRGVRYSGGTVRGTVSPDDYYITAKTARKHGVRIRAGARRGLYFDVIRYSGRAGIYVGALVFGAMLCAGQATVADISIDGDAPREQVLRILEECGIREGTLNYGLPTLRAERKLMLELEDASWVDVTCDGYRVNVTIENAVAAPKMLNENTPCNIIASRDAMIYDHTVRKGTLTVEPGSGAAKGSLLVSGIVVDGAGNVSYCHASAEVIGEFTETREFFVPYKETLKIADGERKQYNYLLFMDDIYPLFLGEAGAEDSVYSEETHLLTFLGTTLPFKLRVGTYTAYRSADITRTNDDCTYELKRLRSDFEENFYPDFEIVNAIERYYPEEDGIRLVMEYTLRGNIAQEQAIEVSGNY